MIVLRFKQVETPRLRFRGPDDRTVAEVYSGGTSVVVAVVGPPGPPGAGSAVGPGFKLVGAEIRYDISSLTGG